MMSDSESLSSWFIRTPFRFRLHGNRNGGTLHVWETLQWLQQKRCMCQFASRSTPPW
jgi:hypothetical protein